MTAQRDVELLQDRALADSARRGRRAAFDELYRRHATASWRLASAVTRHPGAAETAVASAFATTVTGRSAAAGASDERLRLTLLRATRRAAVDAVGEGAKAGPATGALSFEAGEQRTTLVRQSFDALPERWRSIVWLVDVEGCSLYDAATVLELAPEHAAALADRARLGLREQVLQVGSQHITPQDCRRSTDHLSGYLMGTLAERDEARVRIHLDGCGPCRDRLAALDDLVPVLRGTALALPVLLADDVAQRWSTSLVRNTGPLHLALPGGQPMPAWAERAFAGTLAAVIALGVTGATMVAGRGRARENTALGTANGESALAIPGLSDLVLDSLVYLPTSVATAPGADAATPSDGAASSSGAPLPRSIASSTSPVARGTTPGLTPAPGSATPPPGPTPPPAPPPPPPTTPIPENPITPVLEPVLEPVFEPVVEPVLDAVSGLLGL